MDDVTYNRETYLNNILDIMKSGKAEGEIKTQLDNLLGNVEKKVSLMTFERNMKTLQPESSYVNRI